MQEIGSKRWKFCETCNHRRGAVCGVNSAPIGTLIARPESTCPIGEWGPEVAVVKGKGTAGADDFRALRRGREQHLGFQIGQYLQPPPLLFTRDGHNAWLGDSLRGATCFLICSGPSLGSHDLGRLNRPGILTAAVNNAAIAPPVVEARHRPHYWFAVDGAAKFSTAIWRDPAITKFFPFDKTEEKLRQWNGHDFETLSARVGDMPSVYFYRRNEDFVPAQWLSESTVNWGQHSAKVDGEGLQSKRSVMLPAVRILYFLGVRKIFLLGCDFHMASGEPYAFPQGKDKAGCRHNNKLYSTLDQRFAALLPYFQEAGLEIFNCTEKSGLTAFAHVSYQDAIASVTDDFPEPHTDGHYQT